MKIGLFFAITAGISYIVSPYKRYALTGAGSRYVGLIFMMAIACLYITVSFCYEFNRKDVFAGLSIAFLINVLAVLNFLGMDPLGFFTDMKTNNIPQFISTIGNINVYGAYTVLMTSISGYLFMVTESNRLRVIYLLYLITGIMGIIVSNSDSACLGLLAFLIAIPILIFQSMKHLREYLLLLAMICFSGKTLGLLMMIRENKVRNLDSIMASFVYENVYFVILFLCIALVAYIDYNNKLHDFVFSTNAMIRFRKVYASIAIIILCVILGSIFYFSMIDTTSDIGVAGNYIRFNDKWGSERGFIWKNLINGYGNVPFIHKLFGTGEGTVSCILSDYSSAHWNLSHGALIDNAHNIPLHILVTTGIAGLVSFLTMIMYAVKRTISTIKSLDILIHNEDSHMVVALGIGMISYFIQSGFNILETITFPIFICMLGIINSYEINDNRVSWRK